VEEAIRARVGRLGEEAQEAAQLATVLGKAFDFDLLQSAWGHDVETTLQALDDLLRGRLIEEGADEADPDYLFTHHKIQEVVYGGLPRRQRQYLHGQVGVALEGLLGSEAGARAGELAFHFEQAQQLNGKWTEKAIDYLLQAGNQAVRQSASHEAIAYYRRGLDIVRTLHETPQRLRQQIDLQTALTLPTTSVHGYGSPEARRVYEEARRLCRRHGDSGALFTTLVGLARYYGMAGDYATAVELAEQLVASAEIPQRAGWLVEAYRLKGSFAISLGRPQEGRLLLEQSLALYGPAYHERHAYRFGHDPAMASLQYLGTAVWLLGYPEQARQRLQELQKHSQVLVHPTSQVIAQCMLAKNACMLQDREAALHYADEGLRLGQSHGLPMWMALARALRGCALFWLGERTGLDQLVEGTAAWRATGALHFTPFLLALQGEAFLEAHSLEAGQAAMADALAIAQNGGDIDWLAELQRLRGELCWAGGADGRAVEACFRESLETAHRQGARMLELRAATSLARLWLSQDRLEPARQLLTEVYDQFDEGFDTPDLLAARHLIDSLG
jgi:adenylate cyclase